MNVFVSGGAKNGKSMFAQKTARDMAEEKGLPLYYIATMIPRDHEDRERIARHRREREGWGFETIECGEGLAGLLDGFVGATETGDEAGSPHRDEAAGMAPQGVFLLDSVTALLSNEMFREDGSVDHEAPERVAEDCVAFAKATKNTVFVSDYIYGDGIGYDKLSEEYRHGLAMIDRRLAQVCERVVEVSAGIVEDWKQDGRDARQTGA